MSSKLKFSFFGHQTFPLRQLWPQKAYIYSKNLEQYKGKTDDKKRAAMRALVIGSNMVDSMIFWARSCGLYDTDDTPSELAELLLDQDFGLDPFCEDPTTIWLMHWNIAKESKALTTLWFLFNIFSKTQFTKADVQKELTSYLQKQQGAGLIRALPTENTLARDIDTILRGYAPRYTEAGRLKLKGSNLDNSEDALDALFRELSLIGSTQRGFYFNRGSHHTLSPYLFAYCYIDFWQQQELSPTLDLNKVAYQAGSPGRVFKLDELSLEDYLVELEDLTEGKLKWTEQTGLRHVICSVQDHSELEGLKIELLKEAYLD